MRRNLLSSTFRAYSVSSSLRYVQNGNALSSCSEPIPSFPITLLDQQAKPPLSLKRFFHHGRHPLHNVSISGLSPSHLHNIRHPHRRKFTLQTQTWCHVPRQSGHVLSDDDGTCLGGMSLQDLILSSLFPKRIEFFAGEFSGSVRRRIMKVARDDGGRALDSRGHSNGCFGHVCITSLEAAWCRGPFPRSRDITDILRASSRGLDLVALCA
ncbi:hypothetical protein L202_07380 [Cryptococcus amylolentus CBS 6039]|uniref:Uncharacterized protein n=1 Tax=Cryptococcus amylolentus CBS 6039 TaxID=1295533 RepID=A0A1E3HBY4_9TREE|nr:hypothetical protein L202_07380 [Cryptococcus amylolentus CBS 6039]ODN73858.1 hypothetical protein L202_07380 [Cryptococcus amylolentus CBS 6039]